MTTSRLNRLNAVISRVVAGFQPPEDLTVSEWADAKRYLSPESSAEPALGALPKRRTSRSRWIASAIQR